MPSITLSAYPTLHIVVATQLGFSLANGIRHQRPIKIPILIVQVIIELGKFKIF